MPNLPALTPEAVAAHIAGWPRNAQSYIMARLRDPDKPKVDVLRDSCGLSDQAVYRWRHGGLYGPGVPGFAELDRAIDEGKPMLQLELARAALLNAAPSAAERLIHRALDMPTDTDRQLQVAHQAGIAILEATGVIQRAPAVVIDNRRVDAVALQAWQAGGAEAWQGKRRPRILPAAVQNDDMPPSEPPTGAKHDE